MQVNKRLYGVFLALAAAASGQIPANTPLRVRVSYLVLDGLAIKRALPAVPCSADKAHQKGIVTVGLLVDNDGKVKSATPVSGDSVLTDCAIRAISQWRYEPYSINGTYVQVESKVVMKFSPKRAEIVVGSR